MKLIKWNAKQFTRADCLLKSMIMVSEDAAKALVENAPLPLKLTQKVQLALANLDEEKETISLALEARCSENKFLDVINAATNTLSIAEAALVAIGVYKDAIA